MKEEEIKEKRYLLAVGEGFCSVLTPQKKMQITCRKR